MPENAATDDEAPDPAPPARGKVSLAVLLQVAAAVVVVAVAGVFVFAAQHRTAPAESPSSKPTQLPPTAPPGAADAVTIVDNLAQADGVVPNKVWYETGINTVVAYVPPGSDPQVAEFTGQVDSLAAGTKGFSIMVVQVDRSVVDTLSVQKEVEADTAYLAAHGVKVAGEGISPDGATVNVSIARGSLPAARTLFRDRYGAGIVVEQATAQSGN